MKFLLVWAEYSTRKGFKYYLFSSASVFTSSCSISIEIGAFTASLTLTLFPPVRFLQQMVSAHFLFTDCLSSLSISSANNVFTLPVTHGPFSLSNIFTQQSILQKQKLDSASKKMTKSWSHILPIHNAEIEFYLHAVVGHHSTFSFIISKTCFFIQLVMKMKGKVLIYNSLYAQSLLYKL